MSMLLQATEAVAETTEKAQTMGLGELFLAGGWLMWPLLALGGRDRSSSSASASGRSSKASGDGRQLHEPYPRPDLRRERSPLPMQLCRSSSTPISHMIEKGIERIGRPLSDVNTFDRKRRRTSRCRSSSAGCRFLAMIAGGAPMIGFPRYRARYGAGLYEHGCRPARNGRYDGILASGMYVAMVTTVGGLMVGMPAYFGYNYLVARIERLGIPDGGQFDRLYGYPQPAG